MNSVLAVDLGGTKTAMALVDANGAISERHRFDASHSLEEAVAVIAEYAASARAAAVGVIVPGIYNSRDGTAWAPNLWGRDYVPLRNNLSARLLVPAAFTNDRAGHVLGEQWLGAARGLNDVLFVAVGTGIGVGILSGGRLIDGAHGIAGSAGWMVIGPGWKDDYARCGCWEAEAAGPAVARRAGIPAEAVVEAARRGDQQARRVLGETAEYLAMGVANLISVFDPEMIVFGGGLMQAGDLLLDDIRRLVPQWAQPVTAKLVRIEMTQLGEDAGLLGAARVAHLQMA